MPEDHVGVEGGVDGEGVRLLIDRFESMRHQHGFETTSADRSSRLAIRGDHHSCPRFSVAGAFDVDQRDEHRPLSDFSLEKLPYFGEIAHAFGTSSAKGSLRRRCPVAAKMAFATAGTTGQTVGSPIPNGDSAPLWTICVSMTGVSCSRSTS